MPKTIGEQATVNIVEDASQIVIVWNQDGSARVEILPTRKIVKDGEIMSSQPSPNGAISRGFKPDAEGLRQEVYSGGGKSLTVGDLLAGLQALHDVWAEEDSVTLAQRKADADKQADDQLVRAKETFEAAQKEVERRRGKSA